MDMNILTLNNGLEQVAALLISFGAIIGKANPLQLVIMTLLECVFYSFNKSLFLNGSAIDSADAGGTIQIHMFGAYFGLAVSMMLGKPSKSTEEEISHTNDLFSMLGTLFLFIYWPSFNGGDLVPNSHPQQRACFNTVLSLACATVGTFVTSSYLNSSWKIRPVDIQNATLAGGVAIGAVCNYTLNACDVMSIGLIAGVLSTYGFARIQPMLENSFGLHDTCGIHNLHGMPSIFGGFMSVFVAAHKGPLGHDMPDVFTHKDQGGRQFAAILITLVISIPAGILTGYIMRKFQSVSNVEPFSDVAYFEIAPYSDDCTDEEAALGGVGGGGGEGQYGKLDSQHGGSADGNGEEDGHDMRVLPDHEVAEVKHVKL
jgi:ammonium transporter Rh